MNLAEALMTIHPSADPLDQRQNWQRIKTHVLPAIAAGLAGTAATGHGHAISDVTGLEAALAAKLEDAPSDGKFYARKDGAWVEVVAGESPVDAPASPSGLTATAASSSQIDLAWTDNSTDETGFRVEQSADSATWATIHTTAADAVSYSVTGLAAETQYWYRVRALGASANSATSGTATATTPAAIGQSVFTSAPTGTPRSNYTGEMGYYFTLSANISVLRLGRFHTSGNTQNHQIRIWIASTSAVIADATVLAASTADADGFKWQDLASPVTLTAGVTYSIGSHETNGGDVWLDYCDVTGKLATVVSTLINKFNNANEMPSVNGGESNRSFSTPAFYFEEP